MGAVIFVCFYIFVAGVQFLSLPRRFSQPSDFQTRVLLLLPPGIGGSNISVSGDSKQAQKMWDQSHYTSI